MKSINIIQLARKKLARRKISENMVSEALLKPDQIIKSHSKRNIAHKRYMLGDKEYLLRVVYEEYEREYVVITAYLTSQISRYWEEK